MNTQYWFEAAKNGNIYLLQATIDMNKNKKNSKGETALMIAIDHQQLKCAEFLAQYELMNVDNDEKTALIHSAKQDLLTDTIVLLKNEAMMTDKFHKSALCYYSVHADLQSQLYKESDCCCIIEESTLYYPETCNPIRITKEHGNIEFSQLIQKYINDNFKNLEFKRVYEQRQTLINPITNVNEWFEAARIGDYNALKAAVQQFKGKQNENSETALIIAVKNNNPKSVEILAPYEIGQVDSKGMTALMYAVQGNLIACSQFLLDEKDLKNKFDQTALEMAAEYGNEEVANLIKNCAKKQQLINSVVSEQHTQIKSEFSMVDLKMSFGNYLGLKSTMQKEKTKVIQIKNMDHKNTSVKECNTRIIAESLNSQENDKFDTSQQKDLQQVGVDSQDGLKDRKVKFDASQNPMVRTERNTADTFIASKSQSNDNVQTKSMHDFIKQLGERMAKRIQLIKVELKESELEYQQFQECYPSVFAVFKELK